MASIGVKRMNTVLGHEKDAGESWKRSRCPILVAPSDMTMRIWRRRNMHAAMDGDHPGSRTQYARNGSETCSMKEKAAATYEVAVSTRNVSRKRV